MARLPFFLFTVLLSASGLTGGLRPDPIGNPGQARPNLLFISIDDLNDFVGVLGGHPQARTPNIDRLAARGMLFTNAHCAAPLCNPSRTAVMTGVSPIRSGVLNNGQDWREVEMLRGIETLPTYFRNHGYWTGASGKINHCGHGYDSARLVGGPGAGRQGFIDREAWIERFPSKDAQLAVAPLLCSYGDNPLEFYDWDWQALDVTDNETEDGQAVLWAEAKLEQEFDRPFFMGVGIFRPHAPHYVPRAYFEAFPIEGIMLPEYPPDDLDDVPLIAGENRRIREVHARVIEMGLAREAVQAYLASVLFVDAMVGRLLDALDASRYADNTIVCLWSDHGWHLGEKQWWHKNSLWEESTRVPLIIAGPGVTGAGQRCDRAVSLLDLYPTLLELSGLEPNPDNDGLSLVPQLLDPQHPRDRPALIHRGTDSVAVRSDNWRYIRYRDGSEELYDHRMDPGEWTNLASDPAHFDLKEQLAAWIRPSPAVPGPVKP